MSLKSEEAFTAFEAAYEKVHKEVKKMNLKLNKTYAAFKKKSLAPLKQSICKPVISRCCDVVGISKPCGS